MAVRIFKSDNCDTLVLKYLNKAVEVHMKDRLEICEKKIQKDILLRNFGNATIVNRNQ